jgi:hypothetical protein
VKRLDDPLGQGGLLDRPWVFWALVAAATLLGAALRLYGLGKPSFWVDEFFTIARTGTEPLHWAHVLGYLPTWFSLWLHGADLSQISLGNIAEWRALGVTERAARLGPCWVGIATVPALALLARGVAGAGVAGVAALLVAITPWHLYWSQMARFYSTQFLCVGAFVLLFARAMQTGRTACFAAASVAGVLALLSHPTSIFIIGACIAALGLAWVTRAPVPNLSRGARWLALLVGAFLFLAVSSELPLMVHSEAPLRQTAEPSTDLGSFLWLDRIRLSWGPSPRQLVLTTVQRIEPITCAVGLLWAYVTVRRRDPFGVLVSAVAILVPLCAIALGMLFPIGPRYYFPCFIAWALLASMWAVEIDRRLGASAGRLAGISGLLALLVSVGFSSYLYCRDGAGARARWRDACEFVQQHGGNDPVLWSGDGKFQSQYYLGRETQPLAAAGDVASLAPGTWVIHRSRGAEAPIRGDVLEVKARYEIPSKPWSWVLYVLRVPARDSRPGAARP